MTTHSAMQSTASMEPVSWPYPPGYRLDEWVDEQRNAGIRFVYPSVFNKIWKGAPGLRLGKAISRLERLILKAYQVESTSAKRFQQLTSRYDRLYAAAIALASR